MKDQKQNLNQDSDQNNQKPFLSSLTAKIILALVIFAGSAIIIISGAKFIAEYYKTQNPEINNQTVKSVNDQDKMFYCNSKKDCVLINFDCSLCECDLRAVNKNYKDEICKNFTGEYCDRVCKFKNYGCINHKCKIK